MYHTSSRFSCLHSDPNPWCELVRTTANDNSDALKLNTAKIKAVGYVDRSLCLCARIHTRKCGICEYEWQACMRMCVRDVCTCARARAEGADDSVYLRLRE